MKKQVVLICGSMQSGKTSTANFLTGYKMKAGGATSEFEIREDGNLGINAEFVDENGETSEGVGLVDLTKLHYTNDVNYLRFAHDRIWPHAKIASVADSLKGTISVLFGVDLEKLYGTNEDKNAFSIVSWNDVAKFFKGAGVNKLKKEGKWDRNLTLRELCQQFSDVCRQFNQDCFVRSCLDEILNTPYNFYIVPDGRFSNEIEYFDRAEESGQIELKKLYLKRRINDDAHEGENLDKHYDISNFDAIIDNQSMSIAEKNQAVFRHMLEWGWVETNVKA